MRLSTHIASRRLAELAPYGMPLFGFARTRFLPAAHTRLCRQVIFFGDDDELLDKLLALADRCGERPVLFLASDPLGSFVNRHRDVIQERFCIELTSRKVTELLFSKTLFAE